MKRIDGIWTQLTSFENLLQAYRQARRGKRRRPGVAEFGLTFEHELFALQRELRDGSYRPGNYRLFTTYERKPRLIAAAPFRDRVVHHAVMQMIEPMLDARFCQIATPAVRARGYMRRWIAIKPGRRPIGMF